MSDCEKKPGVCETPGFWLSVIDLGSTHLRDPDRLSRLSRAVFLPYVW
ncbi:MAG TPA: hypothetical protein VGK81_10920 [Anaerolineae bacterium]